MKEQVAIVGSGAIACGIAATAAHHGPVQLLARSEQSADRALKTVNRTLERLGAQVDPDHIQISTETSSIEHSTFVIEAIIEHHEAKASLLADLSQRLEDDAVLATTTSSLSIERLSAASGRPDRFVGLHVFNPVTKMQLVELVLPRQAAPTTRSRAEALCSDLGKTAIAVPDVPGFVVNRLLFPYLFNAVTLLEETGIEPADLDTCMKLGAGHPMGPLALLDLVGLDVAKAIGEEIGAPIPPKIDSMIAEGSLGRKTGRGFMVYDR